jgi:hypothetical protein
MHDSPSAIGRHSPVRERVYHVLLSAPGREWTVRDLAAATGPEVSASAARDIVYTLIAAAAMSTVPGNRAVTVRLTNEGLNQLRSIATAWQRGRVV